jgi:LysR family transcriptional regulator, glycine cleavage system transcriptional activator
MPVRIPNKWRKLPPLNALRSFEAAARHLSFTKAADELAVTPAAVSHQVKALEDLLGVTLFRRTKRALLLTDEGQAVLPGIRDGFDRLLAAVEQLGEVGRSGVLTVSLAPSFAVKWLLPRLDRFQAAHPEIDVRVAASNELVDFSAADVDLAIRYGAGRYEGLSVERLIGDTVYPVCSPELLKGANALTAPDRLRHHVLLHDDSPDDDETCPTWQMWLKAAGLANDVDHSRGPRFNQSSLVLEAALLGRGVALAKSTLADADVAAGRLVRPFDVKVPVNFAYYVVYPEAKAALPKVQLFHDWLRREGAAAQDTGKVAPLRVARR